MTDTDTYGTLRGGGGGPHGAAQRGGGKKKGGEAVAPTLGGWAAGSGLVF